MMYRNDGTECIWAVTGIDATAKMETAAAVPGRACRCVEENTVFEDWSLALGLRKFRGLQEGRTEKHQ